MIYVFDMVDRQVRTLMCGRRDEYMNRLPKFDLGGLLYNYPLTHTFSGPAEYLTWVTDNKFICGSVCR